ncbi:MAG: hypothetical protein KUG70_08340 [Rhodobacteraceae bacterium]|nr:hypothetical protein [Paracoccaceae bacterium]
MSEAQIRYDAAIDITFSKHSPAVMMNTRDRAGIMYGSVNDVASLPKQLQPDRVAVDRPSGHARLPALPIWRAGETLMPGSSPVFGAHTKAVIREISGTEKKENHHD